MKQASNTDQIVLKAPKLMLPVAEADHLYQCYTQAKVVLEYGSGGSTLLAAQAGRKVFSVESDVKWHAGMEAWFAATPADAEVHLHYADIGPTKAWGYPVNRAAMMRWSSYPLSVWERSDFEAPDVVLIDGRFRTACFLTVLFRTQKPVKLLWDDYLDREAYHVVERFCRPTRMIGRMAEFDIKPAQIAAENLGFILTQYLRPQ